MSAQFDSVLEVSTKGHVRITIASFAESCSNSREFRGHTWMMSFASREGTFDGLAGPLRENHPKQFLPANQRSHVRFVCGHGLRYAIRQIPLMGRSVGRRTLPIDFPSLGRKTSSRKVACSRSAAIQLTEPEGLSSLTRGSPKATSVSHFTQMQTVSTTRLQSVPVLFLHSTATS